MLATKYAHFFKMNKELLEQLRSCIEEQRHYF